MKKSFVLKINLIILSIYCILYPTALFLTNNDLTILNVMFWILITLFTYFKSGYINKRNIFEKDTVQTTIIFTVTFLIFTYLLGLITGFANTPFSLKPITILKNIFPLIVYYIAKEFYRNMLLSKTQKNNYYIFYITLLFIVSDIIVTLPIYDFNSFEGIFNFIGSSILVGIFRNILLTFISMHVGIKPCIIYLLIMECYIYFVPFVPNLGMYIDVILNTILPILLIFNLSKMYEKKEKVYVVRNKHKKIYYIPVVIFVIFFVSLVSGIFRFQIFAVASNSMQPIFSRGDAVIIDKSKTEEDLKKGDIIMFTKDKKIIVHRIIKVRKYNNIYYYTTKGDNNNTPDNGEVLIDNIIGVVNFKVPLIGYPTVWVSELIE